MYKMYVSGPGLHHPYMITSEAAVCLYLRCPHCSSAMFITGNIYGCDAPAHQNTDDKWLSWNKKEYLKDHVLL